MKKLALWTLTLSAAWWVSCGGGRNSSAPPPTITISVLPAAVTVETGDTVQFTATVRNTTNTAVTWQVEDTTGGDATVGTVNTSGLYTAPAIVPSPAKVTVRAVSQADATKSASSTVTVKQGPSVSVTVSPVTANLASGATLRFDATVENSTNPGVTWRVNGVNGGDATVGTISESGLYTAPALRFDPVTVAIAAVSQADPTKSGTASVNILAAHPIGVREVAGVGEFYDRRSGSIFTPRGNNYVRLATQESFYGGSTFYHSNFNVGLYDAPRSESALQLMEADGYNVIRVFLNGCCVGSIGDPAGGLSSGYLANLTDFLERANSHHIFAILTTDWPPDVAPYNNLVGQQCCTLFNDINLQFLTEGGVEGNSLFFHDLVQGLTAHGARLDAILAYELRNELFFASDQPPLSLTSGTVTTANGQTYDMADPTSKQLMMDENLTWWTDRMRETVLWLDPSALVTVGFFWPQQPNPTRIGDPRVIQPYPAIANSTADFVDLHTYPGLELTLPQYVENFAMSSHLGKPAMMGEFGAFKFVYPNADTSAQTLQSWQVESCSYGFKGWLLWTWDTDEQSELWNGLSDTGAINTSLAPVNRPDPCEQ